MDVLKEISYWSPGNVYFGIGISVIIKKFELLGEKYDFHFVDFSLPNFESLKDMRWLFNHSEKKVVLVTDVHLCELAESIKIKHSCIFLLIHSHDTVDEIVANLRFKHTEGYDSEIDDEGMCFI